MNWKRYTVLDPFCGSGTTMLAAMKNSRNSIGVEVEKKYCKDIYRRLNDGIDIFTQASIECVETLDKPIECIV